MKKLLLLVSCLFTILFESKAQAVQWAMMQDVTTQGAANGPLITSNGTDLICFGRISNTITLGGQTFANNGMNCYLAKHDATGQLLWAKHIQGNVSNEDVIIDQSKNIFISGQFWDSLFVGSLVFTNSQTHGKFFIAKFDPAGNFLWARTSSPGSFAMINALTTDGSGNVFGSGIFRDSMRVSNTTLVPQGSDDIFLVKYDTNGNFQWLKGFGSTGVEYEPILTGGLTGNVFVSYITRVNGFSNFSLNGFNLKKFNTAGQEQWSKFIFHRFVMSPANVKIDASENVYLAASLDTSMTIGNQYLQQQFGAINNIFIAKLSPVGNWIWSKKVQTGLFTTRDVYMIPDKRNELHLLYSDFNNTPGLPNSTINYHVSRLDTAGSILKTSSFLNKPTRLQSTDIFHISDFTSDDVNNIYIAGAIAGTNTFGTITLTAPPSIPGPALPNPSAGYIAKILDNANSVSGVLFIDQNGNGLKDAGEKAYENGIVGLAQGAPYASSDVNGAYKIFLIPGTFNLQVHQPSAHYTFSPQTHSVTFTGVGQTQTKDFAIQPIPNRNDVKISVTNITPARPGFTLKYRITYENVGTTTLSDSLTLQYTANHLTYTASSVSPGYQQTGKMGWYYQNLLPNTKRDIDVTFTVAASTPINTNLNAVASIKPFITDHITENNIDNFQHPITGSFDPNDKQVNHAELTPAQVANNELLYYVIRFQNTGNDTAFTVVVRDSISANLRMSSFEMLSASHPYTFRLLENGQAEWRFNNILLPDSGRNELASHGFIRYRMKPKSSLVLGDEIKSRAAIYFDYNAPVHTNYAVTRISLTNGIKERTTNIQAFKLYPNPAKNYVMVEAEFKKNTTATVSLVNLLGQTISNVTLPANNQIHYQMPLQEMPKGVYLIRLETETGMQTQRLVIQ